MILVGLSAPPLTFNADHFPAFGNRASVLTASGIQHTGITPNQSPVPLLPLPAGSDTSAATSVGSPVICPTGAFLDPSSGLCIPSSGSTTTLFPSAPAPIAASTIPWGWIGVIGAVAIGLTIALASRKRPLEQAAA